MQIILFLSALPLLFTFKGGPSVVASGDDLIYTTRDFYFDMQPSCPTEQFCHKDFSMILTFDIAVTMQDEIKDIGFKSADMEFLARGSAKQSFQPMKFTKYEHTFTKEGKKLSITFYPDKGTGTAPQPITKCQFDGYVREKGGAAGNFVFYLSNGSTYSFQFY